MICCVEMFQPTRTCPTVKLKVWGEETFEDGRARRVCRKQQPKCHLRAELERVGKGKLLRPRPKAALTGLGAAVAAAASSSSTLLHPAGLPLPSTSSQK